MKKAGKLWLLLSWYVEKYKRKSDLIWKDQKDIIKNRPRILSTVILKNCAFYNYLYNYEGTNKNILKYDFFIELFSGIPYGLHSYMHLRRSNGNKKNK